MLIKDNNLHSELSSNAKLLLSRELRDLDDGSVGEFYKNKRVLVTGGGGSIGSELVRKIAEFSPELIIILDIYENNAYDLCEDLKQEYGGTLPVVVEIGSVRDRARVEDIFAAHRPDIVFHAAAHKHVPLMERAPGEAVKNNCFGTYIVADAAEKFGVKNFILVSTDKAVNPTNVMGATKRLCEMIVESRKDSKTVFSAVRFGNVLASRGSVIPLFQRQIENGGPLTLTDKRVIRYFMTVSEAVGLLLRAGSVSQSGELLVLDMGEPIRIYDIAKRMIEIAGLVPYRDIDIVEIGLRPGEKLYEEPLTGKATQRKTKDELIFVERDDPISRDEIEEKLKRLYSALTVPGDKEDSYGVVMTLREVVPTFSLADEVNGAYNPVL